MAKDQVGDTGMTEEEYAKAVQDAEELLKRKKDKLDKERGDAKRNLLGFGVPSGRGGRATRRGGRRARR